MNQDSPEQSTPKDVKQTVFGIDRAQFLSILKKATGLDEIISYQITFEHEITGFKGYFADKVIPTIFYDTSDGYQHFITLLAKRFHNDLEVDISLYFNELAKVNAPIPKYYGSVKGTKGEEILFMEYLPKIGIDETKPDEYKKFLSLIAQFNSTKITENLQEQLPKINLSKELTSASVYLAEIWRYALKGDLGTELEILCRDSQHLLAGLGNYIGNLSWHVGKMKQGFLHRDFSMQNTGWDNHGNYKIFDLHEMGYAPRFYDISRWLGADEEEEIRCLPREELIDYYIETFCAITSETLDKTQFTEEIGILWEAQVLRGLGWDFTRALDGIVDWTTDVEEGKQVYQLSLTETIGILITKVSEHYKPPKEKVFSLKSKLFQGPKKGDDFSF